MEGTVQRKTRGFYQASRGRGNFLFLMMFYINL